MHTISILITISLPLLDFRIVHLCLIIRGGVCQILKDGAGIEQARVEALRSLEAPAYDENFGRDVSGGGGLRRVDFGEQLVENPQQGVVVLGSEDFGLRKMSCQPILGPLHRFKQKRTTKVPPSIRNSVASFSEWSASSAWLNESCTQAVPTLGAPSWSTQSAFHVFRWLRMVARHFSVVISLWKEMTRGIALMGARSTPMMRLSLGIVSAHT